jgi:hypothetical protein
MPTPSVNWARLAGKGHYSREGVFERLDPTNAIVGTGRIEGRKVALHVDDFTIRAGSSEATIADKWIYIERMAHQLRMPLVRLVDSAGGSVKLLMQIGGTKIPNTPAGRPMSCSRPCPWWAWPWVPAPARAPSRCCHRTSR